MKIALAGNPNSGKTTMYNALTGQSEKTGNWAGVTVDKKEHSVKNQYAKGQRIFAVDLPGAYSMSPFTSEESITSTFVRQEGADVLINIVDATNLSRSLFFTTQLLELGIPTVVALNKSDLNAKGETSIDVSLLERRLGCPVVQTASTSGEGLEELVQTVLAQAGKGQAAPFTPPVVNWRDKTSVQQADRLRYRFVRETVQAVESREKKARFDSFHDRLDKVLTNKWVGIPVFALVMFLVFQISQTWLGAWIAEGVELPNGTFVPGLVTYLEQFQTWLGGLLQNADPLLTALLVDGILGGVIAVIGFLPLVAVMYFLIALLEDCGYMSRVAVVLDPIFQKVGLSGKSVIPFVITVGCAVPGIMASRTVRDERQRRATVMLAPFMPCGAKIPVISLFAGAFFGNAGWVSAAMYLTGILLIFLGAWLVHRITGASRKKNYFLLELPDYKVPSLKTAFSSMASRGWEYVVKASTVILLCNTAVQVMQTFDWSFQVAASSGSSILASLALPFAYLLVPIVGVVSWELAAAAVTGFIAKENVVGTLAVCFVGLENLIDLEELSLLEGAGEEVAGILAISKAAALAYLMFNLYTPPCFAAIGAMRSEMKSTGWLLAGVLLQFAVGYTVSYLVYTLGTLLTAPWLLHLPAALAGGAAVVAMTFAVSIMAAKSKNREERKWKI